MDRCQIRTAELATSVGPLGHVSTKSLHDKCSGVIIIPTYLDMFSFIPYPYIQIYIVPCNVYFFNGKDVIIAIHCDTHMFAIGYPHYFPCHRDPQGLQAHWLPRLRLPPHPVPSLSALTPTVPRGWDHICMVISWWWLFPHMPYIYMPYLFNIAMENGPFIDGLPIKNSDFPWLCNK